MRIDFNEETNLDLLNEYCPNLTQQDRIDLNSLMIIIKKQRPDVEFEFAEKHPVVCMYYKLFNIKIKSLFNFSLNIDFSATFKRSFQEFNRYLNYIQNDTLLELVSLLNYRRDFPMNDKDFSLLKKIDTYISKQTQKRFLNELKGYILPLVESYGNMYGDYKIKVKAPNTIVEFCFDYEDTNFEQQLDNWIRLRKLLQKMIMVGELTK